MRDDDHIGQVKTSVLSSFLAQVGNSGILWRAKAQHSAHELLRRLENLEDHDVADLILFIVPHLKRNAPFET